jgi:hypothetical protein
MAPRPATVNALAQAALAGMETVESTGAEVVSACMTLAMRAVQTCLEQGVQPEALRPSVERLWELVAPPVGRAS